ncbi:MAG: transglutaminase family protein [Pseudomonadota bacterium]
MIYDVRHRTTYRYGGVVTRSDHRLSLAPRSTPHQQVRSFSLDVTPNVARLSPQLDYFGNAIHFLAVEEPHEVLTVEARSRVDVAGAPDPIGFDTVEMVVEAAARPSSPEALEAAEFAFSSPYTKADDAIEDFARAVFAPDRPVMEAARELTARIHDGFAYDPAATDAATTGIDAFVKRAGVCQDFSHIFLAACRSVGLPARYVSGYILTRPPEGRERLVGADASHAWVAVWSPVAGWVDFDPTNDMIPTEEHITTAWGLDYADVSPIRGVVLGGGDHLIDLAVDVTPVL